MNTIRLALVLTLLSAGAAAAQEPPCRGEAPAAGVEIRGPVLHVLDGHTLCVATGADPAAWRPIVLADAPADAAWGALMDVAFGKDVTCTGSVCRIDGRSIGERLQDPAAAKAGVAWRRPTGLDAPRPSVRLQVAATS